MTDNMQVVFFIKIVLLPVLYLAANIYTHLVGVFGNDEIYKMFCARLELELALIEIAHSLHHHLYERLTIVNALRHNDSRKACVAVLMCYDGLARALHIACSHTSLKVDGGSRHGAVYIYLGVGGHVALKIFSLYKAYLELAHDMLEGQAYRRIRCLDVLAGGKEEVARLITAESGGCPGGALVGADTERLVRDAAYSFYEWIVSVGIEQSFVPIQ